MFRQRSVAGFAVHVRMFALALHIQHIGVAGFASLVAGKLHGVGGDLANGGAAIVPVLSKTLRNDVTSNNKKDNKGENKKSRKSEEMPGILENAHCSPIS